MSARHSRRLVLSDVAIGCHHKISESRRCLPVCDTQWVPFRVGVWAFDRDPGAHHEGCHFKVTDQLRQKPPTLHYQLPPCYRAPPISSTGYIYTQHTFCECLTAWKCQTVLCMQLFYFSKPGWNQPRKLRYSKIAFCSVESQWSTEPLAVVELSWDRWLGPIRFQPARAASTVNISYSGILVVAVIDKTEVCWAGLGLVNIAEHCFGALDPGKAAHTGFHDSSHSVYQSSRDMPTASAACLATDHRSIKFPLIRMLPASAQASSCTVGGAGRHSWGPQT